MALGISGSNGGVSGKQYRFSTKHLEESNFWENHVFPLEVSYFINNICNLKCRHCYVGYDNNTASLTTEEWLRSFDDLIDVGARIFGNVGKEPLMNWKETEELLLYFAQKKQVIPGLKFGLVTNGTLFDIEKINSLEQIKPDYIDISLDGNLDTHDRIRGRRSYNRLFTNLMKLSQNEVSQKVFISFTLNRINASSIADVVRDMYRLGLKKMLVSPYITLDKKDPLYISDKEIIEIIGKLLDGEIVNFENYQGIQVYVKNDFLTSRHLMEKLVDLDIIKKDELRIDEYGVIFNQYTFGANVVYFNYMPFDTSYVHSIRISHDGYVGNCYDMFFNDFPSRAIGNLKLKPIHEILEPYVLNRMELESCKQTAFEFECHKD